jgi:signal transduction histidine kinase
LPVILVTGYSDDATIVRALRAGVRDYVFKSVEYLDYLPEAVRRVLEQEHTKAELLRTAQEREKALRELREKNDELRSATQQLWQAARLAGVGELAASIAHELNNPLGTVSLRIEGVLARTPPDDPRRRPLEVVEQEVERMGKLVANLLNFSRAGRDQVSTVCVPEELRKTIELTEPHLRRLRVQVAPEFHPVPDIFADRQQLRQLFLNLFTNAGDAMPSGGRLIPRVRPGELPPARRAVVVEVEDTGVGIPPELLPKVTEPFFTTKEDGKGTGLGLAICRRIVQEHHGTLEIDSEVGKGTRVRITLPVRNGTNVNGLQSD